ncbi:unnamed protein product, partial [Amoebophrya sp. A25]
GVGGGSLPPAISSYFGGRPHAAHHDAGSYYTPSSPPHMDNIHNLAYHLNAAFNGNFPAPGEGIGGQLGLGHPGATNNATSSTWPPSTSAAQEHANHYYNTPSGILELLS